MSDPSVNRRLFFGFDEDDDYTEKDLERDLKKTQTLPFAQIGTPSPYRAPPKSRIGGAVKQVAAIKPLTFNKQPQPTVAEVHVEVLKTPVNNRGGKSSQVALQEASVPTLEPLSFPIPAPVFNQAPSAQKPTVKVVPSRYMQATGPKNASKENQGGVAVSKPSLPSSKKAIGNTQKKPLVAVNTDPNAPIDPDRRRTTTAGAKKNSSASTTTSTTSNKVNRTSVGPQATNISVQSTHAPSVQSSASQVQLQGSTLSGASVPSTPSIYQSQADLRAEVLRRREQRQAQAAAKQAGTATAKQSRPSIGASLSSSQASTASRESMGPLPTKTPHDARKSLQRHSSSLAGMRASGASSSYLASSGSSVSVASQNSSYSNGSNANDSVSVKIVPSRYMSFKSEAPGQIPSSRLSIDGGSEEKSSAGPTPTRTPRGTLKKSFSTSSLKKEHPSKKASEISSNAQDKAQSSISARVAAVTSSHASSTSLTQYGASNVSDAKKPVNMQALQLETQLMQSQLLQWHFINHRLEQAFNAKKASSMHMITMVWHKIVALEESLKAAAESLAEQQVQVYQVELEQFKVQCMAPLLQSIHEFMFRYSSTALHLSQDTHKMPSVGISKSSSTDPRALLMALGEGKDILDSIETEFVHQMGGWQKIGGAMQALTAVVQEETKDLKTFSEMLHAMASLNTHEASLILHKLQLQQTE